MIKIYIIFSLLSFTLYASSFVNSVAKQELVKHGKRAYLGRCSGCHGKLGDGNGPAAKFLNPRPRDFTKGIFKFRSTPIGSLPQDQDIIRTITLGVLGTSMPSFRYLSDVEKLALTEYIKSFDPNLQEIIKESEPVVVGAPFIREDFQNYKKFKTRATKGKKIFIEACGICHGTGGLGDGPESGDLEDEWGQKIVPANLTKPFIKSGRSIKDIYRVILTGIDGTPMPSFKDTYDDNALWDLAAFVFYLRGLGNGIYDKSNPPIAPIKKEEITE